MLEEDSGSDDNFGESDHFGDSVGGHFGEFTGSVHSRFASSSSLLLSSLELSDTQVYEPYIRALLEVRLGDRIHPSGVEDSGCRVSLSLPLYHKLSLSLPLSPGSTKLVCHWVLGGGGFL